eukprot:1733597-Amphidinium_carterae.2
MKHHLAEQNFDTEFILFILTARNIMQTFGLQYAVSFVYTCCHYPVHWPPSATTPTRTPY